MLSQEFPGYIISCSWTILYLQPRLSGKLLKCVQMPVHVLSKAGLEVAGAEGLSIGPVLTYPYIVVPSFQEKTVVHLGLSYWDATATTRTVRQRLSVIASRQCGRPSQKLRGLLRCPTVPIEKETCCSARYSCAIRAMGLGSATSQK